MTTDEIQDSKLAVYAQSGFPGVLGFVDGTHVRICGPRKEVQHLYLNRKGYYSLNVMIFSDYKQNIGFVDARYTGSNHDSHIWNVSTLKQRLDQNLPTNTWILGDTGYPLGRIIMTSFRNTVDG
ncbi:putative nuclease HARBI1 [Rhagoletis pomonella]|uniref:putative nuclease HARBI1 n=1 Tax=Rhagoletis pomonella TaxID=28610 RepID=UPI0017849A9F|nr:putative nuclease HARBI1 [Rhagoletis pomonella]XP_036344649.1 putative nuclease HARBI1 [Rhagoletis pomonella]